MVLNTNQIAEIFGVTKRTVAYWGEKGCPQRGRNAWDISEVIQWWADNIYVSERGDSAESLDARERLWKAKAEIEEIKADLLKNKVAYIDDFVKAMTWRVNELTTGLTMLALRLSHNIAAECSKDDDNLEVRVRKILQDEFWKLRDSFSRDGVWY